MRIRRELKAYIEAELRDYNDTIRSIGEEKNDLILATAVHDNNGGTSYDIGNPTESKVMQLITNKRIRHMEETCRAIGNVVDGLNEEKYKLIELRYWKKPKMLTDAGIAQQINIDRATLYRWVDEILIMLGVEMGLINAVSCDKDATFRGY